MDGGEACRGETGGPQNTKCGRGGGSPQRSRWTWRDGTSGIDRNRCHCGPANLALASDACARVRAARVCACAPWATPTLSSSRRGRGPASSRGLAAGGVSNFNNFQGGASSSRVEEPRGRPHSKGMPPRRSRHAAAGVALLRRALRDAPACSLPALRLCLSISTSLLTRSFRFSLVPLRLPTVDSQTG